MPLLFNFECCLDLASAKPFPPNEETFRLNDLFYVNPMPPQGDSHPSKRNFTLCIVYDQICKREIIKSLNFDYHNGYANNGLCSCLFDFE